MKIILLLCLTFSAFAELEPNMALMEVHSFPDEYLAQTAKEACRGDSFSIQERADKACYAWGHLSAVRGGYVIEDNVELEYMLRVSRNDAYDWVEVDTKLYECKRDGLHKKMLRPWKFIKINCLTY